MTEIMTGPQKVIMTHPQNYSCRITASQPMVTQSFLGAWPLACIYNLLQGSAVKNQQHYLWYFFDNFQQKKKSIWENGIL